MIRVFKLESGLDLTIILAIDTEIITQQWAGEIARFWSSKDEVLAASDDDEYQAVARYAAQWLWGYLLEGYTAEGAVLELHEQEGWCIPTPTLGVVIRDHDIPSMAAADLEVSEIQQVTP